MDLVQINQWSVFELTLEGPREGNPYTGVLLEAVFYCTDSEVTAEGFYDGDGIYKIRFMPHTRGRWNYTTRSSIPAMNGLEGSLQCVAPEPGNHGPVRVRDGFHFAFADGTPFFPMGTTVYSWIHQPDRLQEETLETLRRSPFNKLRMCVFPHDFGSNKEQLTCEPFEKDTNGRLDFQRMNPRFFKHLEKRIAALGSMGIEVDLILFHPYDCWGYASMGQEADVRYLRYIIARLAAYRNIWWSLANEYDLLKAKNDENWDHLFQTVEKYDPYGHLRSIHNYLRFYNHAMPWVTHLSLQRVDWYKTTEEINEWRKSYGKPVVYDECGYEGDMNQNWGNLTAWEFLRRFWEGTVRGGYVGHGESYMLPGNRLCLSQGGRMQGECIQRLAFAKEILNEAVRYGISPLTFGREDVCGGAEGLCYLVYSGFTQPAWKAFQLPADRDFTIDIVDTWNMTVTRIPGLFRGDCRVELPRKPFLLLRILKS